MSMSHYCFSSDQRKEGGGGGLLSSDSLGEERLANARRAKTKQKKITIWAPLHNLCMLC